MPLASIHALVKDDLEATNRAIFTHVKADFPLVNTIMEYMLSCGGKRIRPLILLLTTLALTRRQPSHIDFAAVIELIHTATLLHDDVVDSSTLRRGNKTAHMVWNTQTSILVGDFLYLRAFQVVIDHRHEVILNIFSQATQLLAQGELLQLSNCKNPDTTEAFYFDIIQRKTAKLFEIAAQLGALLATDSPTQIEAMREFGMNIGLAYQLIDDALDYSQPAEETGKNMGQDLSEGKTTLPLIYAMQKSKKSDLSLLREAIQTGSVNNIDAILGIIESTEAIKYTADAARHHAEKAKQALSMIADSPYRNALTQLADFVVERKY